MGRGSGKGSGRGRGGGNKWENGVVARGCVMVRAREWEPHPCLPRQTGRTTPHQPFPRARKATTRKRHMGAYVRPVGGVPPAPLPCPHTAPLPPPHSLSLPLLSPAAVTRARAVPHRSAPSAPSAAGPTLWSPSMLGTTAPSSSSSADGVLLGSIACCCWGWCVCVRAFLPRFRGN
jgi:hypothetical protein